MTVILNEAALSALLDSEQGAVGRDIRQRAERVVVAARRNVAFIMAGSTVNVENDVDFVMAGSDAFIGIRDTGRISQYLDEKAAREPGTPGDWMRNALAEVFV